MLRIHQNAMCCVLTATILLYIACYQYYRLDMRGVGEHVYGLYRSDVIAVGEKVVAVAFLGIGIAAYVDNARWGKSAKRAQEAFVGAAAGWVHEHDVGFIARGSAVLHELACIRTEEARILNAVGARIGLGIAHGVGVALDPDECSGLAARDDTDGAGAAVGVENGLAAVELCHCDGGFVELLGLHGVHLVEGA